MFGLIKFGERAHMKQLLDNGTVFMNSTGFFLDIEDNNLRGDKFESLSEIIPGNNLELYHKDHLVAVAEIAKLSIWNNYPKGNIFCSYTLFTDYHLDGNGIDPGCKEFGDTAIIITDFNKFLSRVNRAVAEQQLNVVYAPVDYLDTSTYEGKWTPFKKPIEYSFQKEFRFFIRGQAYEPLVLNIGPINDIAFMLDSDKIDKLRFVRDTNDKDKILFFLTT
jgi:hypothetical protein